MTITKRFATLLAVLPPDLRRLGYFDLVTLIVRDYDPAIDFFVNALQFELIEDLPSLTNDGRPKRWVVVRPAGAVTGLLLARADGESQAALVGSNLQAVSACFCAWTISKARTSGCWLRASYS